jgi:putative acetyltransferase
VTVRPERPGDVAAIRRVNEAAFGRAAEADLVDALRAHGRVSRSLVAEHAGVIVGHILFSPVRIDSERTSTAAIGLAPMAVLPAHQRAGVGSLLVRTGLDECRRAGHGCVVVLGHPEYYPRFGFVRASRHGLAWEGHSAPDEAFMVLPLREDAIAAGGGVVRYAPEFGQV